MKQHLLHLMGLYSRYTLMNYALRWTSLLFNVIGLPLLIPVQCLPQDQPLTQNILALIKHVGDQAGLVPNVVPQELLYTVKLLLSVGTYCLIFHMEAFSVGAVFSGNNIPILTAPDGVHYSRTREIYSLHMLQYWLCIHSSAMCMGLRLKQTLPLQGTCLPGTDPIQQYINDPVPHLDQFIIYFHFSRSITHFNKFTTSNQNGVMYLKGLFHHDSLKSARQSDGHHRASFRKPTVISCFPWGNLKFLQGRYNMNGRPPNVMQSTSWENTRNSR